MPMLNPRSEIFCIAIATMLLLPACDGLVSVHSTSNTTVLVQNITSDEIPEITFDRQLLVKYHKRYANAASKAHKLQPNIDIVDSIIYWDSVLPMDAVVNTSQLVGSLALNRETTGVDYMILLQCRLVKCPGEWAIAHARSLVYDMANDSIAHQAIVTAQGDTWWIPVFLYVRANPVPSAIDELIANSMASIQTKGLRNIRLVYLWSREAPLTYHVDYDDSNCSSTQYMRVSPCYEYLPE